MRFTNSALALLLSIAGSFFPRPRGVQAAYTHVGAGNCVDCSNTPPESFDYVALGSTASINSATECEAKCLACETALGPTADLVGFHINFFCLCLFNDDGPNLTFGTTCSAQSPSGSNIAVDNTKSGSGGICGVDSSGFGNCYKIVGVPQPSSQPSVSSMPSESSKPSNVPSTKPSMKPSDVPSMKPSDVPSMSMKPSMKPSSNPSSMPSSNPSSMPSSMPSETPSSMPSESPSDDPSSMPSETPSDMPSVSPSDDPSSMPSDQPSVSKAPSDAPSDQPSETPSSSPSEEPSSEPSETPSCSPSSSPTQSPSVDGGVNLFYPDWANGGEPCKNDGAHPDYMEINPTQWLSSTLDACCKKFFGGFLYQQCTGAYPPDADDCTVLLYYPDWNGANEGCVADGQEPLYMLGNAQYFLSNTKEDCCKKFYEWNYYPCTGAAPEGSGSYYPDWNGSPATCKADGNMPDYMLRPDSAPWYLFDTLQECCEKYFHWDLSNCLGDAVTGSNKWYVYYEGKTCVKDCTGVSPCGGIAESWVPTFDTKKACCDAKLWYEADCERTNA